MQLFYQTKIFIILLVMQGLCQSSKDGTKNSELEYLQKLQAMGFMSQGRNLEERTEGGSRTMSTMILELLLKLLHKAPHIFQKLIRFIAHLEHPAGLLDVFHGLLLQEFASLFHEPNQTCYTGYGCFRDEYNMTLPYAGPSAPETVGMRFLYFNNDTHRLEDPVVWTLESWNLSDMTEPDTLPLIILAHGFKGGFNISSWSKPLVQALLDNVKCNLIYADWAEGAKPPNYPRVAANSPMAGAIISLLVQKIINATFCELMPENVTIVGSSLGAQTAAFAGRHFFNTTGMKLGRITGLDPANLLFKGTKVALSREDAQYVDVIHTNQGNIEAFQWGMDRSVGHVDFYPNGGKLQEGCKPYPEIKKINFTAMKSPADLFVALLVSSACSHARAPNLFIESITNHTCNFTSVPCPEGWSNYDNCSREYRNNETLVGLMGYYSFTRQGRGDQFLRTRNSTPFCIPDIPDVEEGTPTTKT